MAMRGVAFDVGGVLIYVARTWGEAAREAGVEIAPHRAEVPLPDFPDFDHYQSGAWTDEVYYEHLAAWLEVDVEAAEAAHRGILQHTYPGMVELVLELREAGLHTGCLSNTNAPHWDMMLRDPCYPVIVALDLKLASHELRLHKPDPAIYLAYAERAGLAPAEIVFFDDSPANVAGAQAVGMSAHLIDWSAPPPAQVRAALATAGDAGSTPA